MRSPRRHVTAAAVAVLSFGGLAATSGTAAAEDAVPVGCEGFGTPVEGQITNLVYGRQGSLAGCVVTSHSATFGTALVRVVVTPGWTYRVKDAGGVAAKTKVVVEFKNETVKDKSNYMITAGKLVSG